MGRIPGVATGFSTGLIAIALSKLEKIIFRVPGGWRERFSR